jgi:hypothetical protein
VLFRNASRSVSGLSVGGVEARRTSLRSCARRWRSFALSIRVYRVAARSPPWSDPVNGLDPEAYLAYVIDRLARGHLASKLGELLPWNYKAAITKAGLKTKPLAVNRGYQLTLTSDRRTSWM